MPSLNVRIKKIKLNVRKYRAITIDMVDVESIENSLLTIKRLSNEQHTKQNIDTLIDLLSPYTEKMVLSDT